MSSFLVHLYQRDNASTTEMGQKFFGLVESIEEEEARQPFTDAAELWNILTAHLQTMPEAPPSRRDQQQ